MASTGQAEFGQLGSEPVNRWLARFGDAMQRHRRIILAVQWSVVVGYLFLIIAPAFLPLPGNSAHLYDNLTLFAQFLFWGVWWPFVMLSMMLMGRVWCGVFCPEGALTEFISRRGLGRAIPKWMRWTGWPFVAFALTTIYGQLISVYEYPKATLLILGGSTVAAIAIGFVYGRGTRVWCRFLCPANGVFRLLARLAPVHFRADAEAWRAAPAHTRAVDCAPLVDVRHLSSMADCHACGRCSGHRGAVRLQARSPNDEVVALRRRDMSRPEVLLLVYGVLGIALGAFQWSASPWFVALKLNVATWLIENDSTALLADGIPWWVLTHYPQANDVFTWLDGLLILFYIGATAIVTGSWVMLWLRIAARMSADRLSLWRIAYCLIPLAGVTVFLGLSALTVTLFRAEGLFISWLTPLRMTLLFIGLSWSAWLAWRIFGAVSSRFIANTAGLGAVIVSMIPIVAALTLQFAYW